MAWDVRPMPTCLLADGEQDGDRDEEADAHRNPVHVAALGYR